MKAREYCCCAIPLVNAGIYLTLTIHVILSLLVGILAVATPSIVGASTPASAPWILAIICFIVTAVQLLGFIAVAREKTILYRRYATLHGIGISAAFSIAAAWIIVSATRHSNAEAKCLLDFFSSTDSASSSTEGSTLCNIFPWADIGIMGGLWVLLGILTLYLFIVLSSYGAAQRRDHDQYDRVYDPSQPLTTEHIPLDNQAHADPWDSRPSIDYNQFGGGYKHVRNNSSVSASDIMNDPYQKPKDGLDNYDYSYEYPNNRTVTRL